MNDLIKVAIGGIRMNYKQYGYIAPTMLVRNKARSVSIISVARVFHDGIPKQARREMLQTILEATDAVEYALVVMCWQRSVHSAEEMEKQLQEYGKVENMPNKTEAVVITYQSIISDDPIVYVCNIHTHNDESWLDSKFKRTGEATGVMLNLFSTPRDWRK